MFWTFHTSKMSWSNCDQNRTYIYLNCTDPNKMRNILSRHLTHPRHFHRAASLREAQGPPPHIANQSPASTQVSIYREYKTDTLHSMYSLIVRMDQCIERDSISLMRFKPHFHRNVFIINYLKYLVIVNNILNKLVKFWKTENVIFWKHFKTTPSKLPIDYSRECILMGHVMYL